MCEICGVPHEAPKLHHVELSNTIFTAFARAAEQRGHVRFGCWVRSLTRRVSEGNYNPLNTLFTTARLLCEGPDMGKDFRSWAQLRKRYPSVIKDRGMRTLAGEVMSVAPVQDEDADLPEFWDGFVKELHRALDR